MPAEAHPDAPDPFHLGGLAAKIASLESRIDKDLGHMPGANGFDDPGAGALKMLAEIRANTVSSSRRHAAWAAGAATLIVALVKIAEGLGVVPVPARGPELRPAPAYEAPPPVR